MWELKSVPKTYQVTKKLASEFAEMLPAPHDRPLSERRLMLYERLLRAGEMRPCTWAKTFCEETGETYRINGKHTSRLYAGLDDPALLRQLMVTIEDYVCPTLEDVAKLYATFDSRAAVRTANDLARAFSGCVPELATLPMRVISLAVTGISWADDPVRWFSVPVAERTEKLLDNVEFVLWLHDIYAGKDRAFFLRRGPVAGAMCATWRKSHKAATDFWLAVRDETGDRPSTPDRKLAKFLSITSIGTGMGTRKGTSRCASPREFYAKCIHGWNAWRAGQATDLKYFATAKLPVIQ